MNNLHQIKSVKMKSLAIMFLLFFIVYQGNGQASLKVSSAKTKNAVVYNYETNVLYIGYDNKITIHPINIPRNFTITCPDCISITKSSIEDTYIVHVGAGKSRIDIIVSGGGKSETFKFNVSPAPEPRCVVSGASAYDSKITSGQLANGFIYMTVPGSPIHFPISVIGGILTISINGVSKEYRFNGSKMPDDAKALIRQLSSGTHVSIKPKIRHGGKESYGKTVEYIIR